MKEAVLRREFLKTALGAAAIGCFGRASAWAQSEPLKLGALYPLTGPVAAFGIQQANGLKVAVEFINQSGGVQGRQVELIFGDATNSATAAAGAERLIESGVPLIFGTASSGLALAASPVAERAGVIYVETGALNAALTERGYKFFFRTRANNQTLANKAMDLTRDVIAPRLRKSPKDLKAVVLQEDSPFGTEIGKLVPAATKEFGGPEIISVDSYNAAATKNFAPLILKYRSLQPDVIYWAAYTSDSILFRRQALERGYTPPSAVAFTSGPGTPDYYAAVGKEGSNGVLVLDVPLGVNPKGVSAEAADLTTAFEHAYKTAHPGESMTGNAYVGFIGGYAVLKYVLPNSAGFKSVDIQAAFREVDVPEGTLSTGGGIRFNEKGQNVRSAVAAMEWQDGQLVLVWPDKLANGQPKYIPMKP